MSIQIRTLDSSEADFKSKLADVLAFEAGEDEAIDRAAATILAAVKARGDAAVLEYTNQFDKLNAQSVAALEISKNELEIALAGLSPLRRGALQFAADRVRAYHERQKSECGSAVTVMPAACNSGMVSSKMRPLDKASVSC